MDHHFDIKIAKKYGVDEAIFLDYLYHWIEKNEANGRHYYEGRYWTYNTIEAYMQIFPYWNYRQIRHIVDKLRNSGLILTAYFNSSNNCKALWYALGDEIYSYYKDCVNGPPGLPDVSAAKEHENTHLRIKDKKGGYGVDDILNICKAECSVVYNRHLNNVNGDYLLGQILGELQGIIAIEDIRELLRAASKKYVVQPKYKSCDLIWVLNHRQKVLSAEDLTFKQQDIESRKSGYDAGEIIKQTGGYSF